MAILPDLWARLPRAGGPGLLRRRAPRGAGYLVVATLTATAPAALVVVIRRGGVLGLLASPAVPSVIADDALTTHHELRALPAALQDPRASAVDAGVGLERSSSPWSCSSCS